MLRRFALAGLASKAELLSAIYAVGALGAEMLTVLVYCVLYKHITGESAGAGVILKKKPKWVHVVLCAFILLGAVLCYIQNVSLSYVAMNMSQIIDGGANSVGMLEQRGVVNRKKIV